MCNNQIKTGRAAASCPAYGQQEVEVSVPVAVRAFANVGNVCTRCLGAPVIRQGCGRGNYGGGCGCNNGCGNSHGRGNCGCGCPESVSEFVISQRLKVDIPVSFGATTDVGCPQSQFSNVTGGSSCGGNSYGNNYGAQEDCGCDCGCGY